ncbi:MAG TPA: hypothetical protein VGF17_09305, partial [Phytomonospora sp.]
MASYSSMRRAVVGLALLAPTLLAAQVRIDPSNSALRFHQLDLTYQLAPETASRYGLATLDFGALSPGYLNVSTGPGSTQWILRNVPVQPGSGIPGLSAMFDLGSPGAKTSIDAYAVVTPGPVETFAPPPGTTLDRFDLGPRLQNNAEGGFVQRQVPALAPINTGALNFHLGGLLSFAWQPGHPNIEQDLNQCFPAAVANSLDWLRTTQRAAVPAANPHVPGIRDNSLVGRLDVAMQRPAHKIVASANDYIDGKLGYIDASPRLRAQLANKHKNLDVFGRLGGDVTVGQTTSRLDRTPRTLAQWLIDEVRANEDVELRVKWEDGSGHMINLVGGGYVLGVPWVAWVHDANQGFVPVRGNPNGRPAANGGVSFRDGGIGFSF